MGLPKGKTNNPHGRPLGALSSMAKEHKCTVDKLLRDNIEKVREEMDKLSGLQFVRLYIDLLKYMIPPAQPEPEEEEQDDSAFFDLEGKIET
jgi:hypothetical protein